MLTCLTLLLGAATLEPSEEARQSEAVEVYSCDFGTSTDVNHDRWPDHWKRQRSPRYPAYIDIGIADADTPNDKRCLQVEMNGGAAMIQSPPIPISPLFSYLLECEVRTSGLKNTGARISANYYDDSGKPVDVAGESRTVGGTHEWTRLRVGPFSTSHQRASYVVIFLHVEPTTAGFDLEGIAQFDDVWLARLPRMMLRSNSPHNVYSDPQDIEISCIVSGIQQRDPMLTFELIDLSSRTLAQMNDRLDGEVVALSSNKITDLISREGSEVVKTDNGYQGEMKWHPPIKENGFFRVRVRMLGDKQVMHEREVTLVVVRPRSPPIGGEFGWSMPDGDKQLALDDITSLLTQIGANWVKFPVWYEPSDRHRADLLAHFIEQLNTGRIELVGMIDQPPPETRKLFSESADRIPAAGVFAEKEVWYPALNPVLTRLTLKVQWWQLGGDDDTSFMGHPQLADKLSEVDQQVARLGQKIRLGLSWTWLNEVPDIESPPWNFLSLNSAPQMTAEEIAKYLQKTPSQGAQRWVMLQPLSEKHYHVDARARDLVLRMLAAKMNGADVTFATDVFDAETGLMNADGTPGELLLPWRTTAYMISGTEFLGSIALPNGSRNYVLTRGDEAIMLVWSDEETEEVINLGDPRSVEHIDLWGRSKQPQQQEHRQVYKVGPLPTFITGISKEMALWRMNFQIVDTKLESLYGRPQFPRFRVKNPFGQSASGKMQLHIPKSWGEHLMPVRINMSGGESRTDRLEVTLRNNASSGEEQVRVDFTVTADRDYRFSAWRKMEVGMGDVVMEFKTRLDEHGNLVVEQTMVNKTDSTVNFKCFLFPPNRRRLRQNVLDLSRGTNLKTYTLPDGEKLIGETLWIRAEEIYGNRVLNYRFEVDPQ